MTESSEDTDKRCENVGSEDTAQDQTEIESYCVACGKNGFTNILLTKIPFFREIIIMSFSCPHCGMSNNNTQFGGRFQENGIRIKLEVRGSKDMDRTVVRSDYATVYLPELDFEIPPLLRNGDVTTIEGVLSRALNDLEADQPLRKQTDPQGASKIEEFLERLQEFRNLKKIFHFILEDPSGNSFIENPCAPQKDDAMEITYYKRSHGDNLLLGINDEELKEEDETETENAKDEVMTFPTNCPNCNLPCDTNMKLTQIPHFKEVIIMATSCDACGHRTNEVKPGAGIEDLGLKIVLQITSPMDMSRDVLKSDTCSLSIPELEFEMGAGALCGRFTTLEGLLQNIKEQLLEVNPFITGDSAQKPAIEKMKDFGETIDEIMACKRKVKVIFDDPAGNSYVQNLYAPEPDPALEITQYKRSFEQNEELGLNDMKTETY